MDVHTEVVLRRAVHEERRRTLAQIAGLQRTYTDIVEATELTSTDDEHDPEGSTIAYERAQVWSLLRQAREDLDGFDDALGRIDDGSIGVCGSCGGEIAVERLLALPHTTRCIGCAR
jgi:DnaK suppressor protein